jgi:hypothetical protein
MSPRKNFTERREHSGKNVGPATLIKARRKATLLEVTAAPIQTKCRFRGDRSEMTSHII